jgi:hypothetical protein
MRERDPNPRIGDNETTLPNGKASAHGDGANAGAEEEAQGKAGGLVSDTYGPYLSEMISVIS